MYLDVDMLPAFFSLPAIERGLSYFTENRVVSLQIGKEGRQYLAEVRGGARRPYHVLVNIHADALGVDSIRCQCGCAASYNCKHAVAVILAANVEEQVALSSTPSPSAARLDAPLRDWLRRVQALRDNAGEASVSKPADELHYVLDVKLEEGGPVLHVDVIKTRPLKSGGWAKGSLFDGGSRSQSRFVSEEDRMLLGALERQSNGRPRGGSGHDLPPGTPAEPWFELMLGTGRCHWQTHRSEALTLGEARQGRPEWMLEESGRYRVKLADLDGCEPLPLAPPWYLDATRGECGPLDTGLDAAVAAALIEAPPLNVDQCAQVRAVLQQLPQEVPLPDVGDIEIRQDIDPVPHLYLHSEEHKFPFNYEADWSDYADLSYRYQGVEVAPGDPRETLPLPGKASKATLIQRQRDAERTHLRTLVEFGFEPDMGVLGARDSMEKEPLRLVNEFGDDGWLTFMLEELPVLREHGWTVDIDASFRFTIADADDWYVDLQEGEGQDWFDLELGIEVDGKHLSLLPMLVQFVAEQRKAKTLRDFLDDEDPRPILVSLEDGRIAPLPIDKVRHVIEALAELYDPDSLNERGAVRLSRYQAGALNDLAEADLKWGGVEAPRRFADKLAGFKGIETVAPPAGLQAELRPYQAQGLSWLQFLREYDLGGILADDMGLGKTIQTLAHLLVEKEAGRAGHPSLVVAPTSLMVNWRREAERFAPSLKVLVLHGPERKRHFPAIAEQDLVLTTYPLLPRDAETLRAQEWHLLVLDEAQNIKNPRAKAAATARELNARHRLCLTGTPMENHLGELWSQFHFLMPGLLGDEKHFRRLFRNPIEKHADATRQRQLQKRVAPFMLRREKAEVVTELPDKTEIVSEVELEGAQRDLYETIRVAMHEKVRREIDKKGIQRSQIIILDALLKLRQVCCDPRLLKMDAAKKVKQSAKLDQLMTMLPEMLEEGRRVLLFSQFTSMLSLIETELGKRKIDYVKLTGQTRDRATPVDRFQNGEVPLFLISLKAGGSGLNLTAADTVIHYDPWWNPAVERQATDRAHRIGQKKAVFVYKFVTRGTVEEKITALQQKKQALADALFGDGKQAARLSEEDLRALFEPLA